LNSSISKADTLLSIENELNLYKTENKILHEIKSQQESELNQILELYENIPLSLIQLNHAGIIIDANKSAQKLLNTTKHSLINRTFSLFIDQKYHFLFAQYRHAVMLEKTHRPCEIEILKKSSCESVLVKLYGNANIASAKEKKVYVLMSAVNQKDQLIQMN